MRFVSLRGAAMACLAMTALFALGMTGVASAKKLPPPNPEILGQCEGKAEIKGQGSTFSAPAEEHWTGYKSNNLEPNGFAGSFNLASLGCSGAKKPVVKYDNTHESVKGSGSCLKTFGKGITTFGEEVASGGELDKFPRVIRYPYCGTDEAPSAATKVAMEKFATEALEPGEENTVENPQQPGEGIETIPAAQGAEAVIIHLPAGCTATSEATSTKGKLQKLGRLSLDRETVQGIYAGTIETWKEAITAQGGHAKDELHCAGTTGEKEAAENSRIRPVVRKDGSGTTHIFKAWLLQLSSTKYPMEAYATINGSEHPCHEGEANTEAGAEYDWAEVAEGCQNQRWPEKAKVLRASVSGNPGVIAEVHNTASSIGYADVSAAAKEGFFTTVADKGGENKKEEQNNQFWAEIQSTPEGAATPEYADPSSKGDNEKAGAESNCKDTVYVSKVGEEFPPHSTRKDWSKVKGEAVSKTYSICGLTYILAMRQYYPFISHYLPTETTEEKEAAAKESLEIATAVNNYVKYVVSTKSGGGAKALKGTLYEGLPKAVAKEAEFGASEIGSKKG